VSQKPTAPLENSTWVTMLAKLAPLDAPLVPTSGEHALDAQTPLPP